jgi:hypothetical protein
LAPSHFRMLSARQKRLNVRSDIPSGFPMAWRAMAFSRLRGAPGGFTTLGSPWRRVRT